MLACLPGAKEKQSGGEGFKDDADRRMPGSLVPADIGPLIFAQIPYKYHRIISPAIPAFNEVDQVFSGAVADQQFGGS